MLYSGHSHKAISIIKDKVTLLYLLLVNIIFRTKILPIVQNA